MPEELWMEVHGSVQGAGIKIIPKEKKCTKAKWLSEETLQIVVNRRGVKGKGENAEFQRIAMRDKKAFRSDQCKEIRGKQKNGKDYRSLQEN